MASAELEKRVKALEDEMARLKVKLENPASESTPWWKQISGIFADDPAFEEAMRLGREWRESFRPKPSRKRKEHGRPGHGSPEPPRKTDVSGKQNIEIRLENLESSLISTTIITYEEQTRGWMAYASRAKSVAEEVIAYARLKTHLHTFRSIHILDFDERAATEYQRLRRQRVRIGAMDLKIAAIVLTRGATLLSRNLGDFRKVPGLKVEDWTLPMSR